MKSPLERDEDLDNADKFSTYDKNVLIFNPIFAKEVGLNQAIFIKQLEYWMGNKKSGKVVNGRKWIRDTSKEWQKQFVFWSTNTIDRTIKKMAQNNLLKVRKDLNKHGYDRTKWYTINFDEVNKIYDNSNLTPNIASQPSDDNNSSIWGNGIHQSGEMEFIKLGDTIPETSSKNSSKGSGSKERDRAVQGLQEKACKTIDYLNEHAHKQFRHSKTSMEPIIARLRDDKLTNKQVKHIIDAKIYDWIHSEKMNKYLNPKTLFRKGNYEYYLNEPLPNESTQGRNSTQKKYKTTKEIQAEREKDELETERKIKAKLKGDNTNE